MKTTAWGGAAIGSFLLAVKRKTGVELNGENNKAQALISELENILQNVYADMVVSRDKVRGIAGEARELSSQDDAWPGGNAEKTEFIATVEKLEKKIFQTLDIRRLKDEGLVKAVRF